MDSYREMLSHSKVILEVGNYSFWKARMKARIKGIDPLAWKAVESGWTAPVARGDDGTYVPKGEELGTDEENKMANFNARALSVIHCSVARKQFELIQGCESAKDAWNILQVHFEGTLKVQSSRKDMLATKFEELKMDEHESIGDFSSKLSSLAQEALTLGKKIQRKEASEKIPKVSTS